MIVDSLQLYSVAAWANIIFTRCLVWAASQVRILKGAICSFYAFEREWHIFH